MPKRPDPRKERSQAFFEAKPYDYPYEPRLRPKVRSAPPEFTPQQPGEDDLKFLLRERRELKKRLKYYARILEVYSDLDAYERERLRLYTRAEVTARVVRTTAAIGDSTRQINSIRAQRSREARHRARRAYEARHPGRREASLRRAALAYVREHPGERDEFFLSILKKRETKRT